MLLIGTKPCCKENAAGSVRPGPAQRTLVAFRVYVLHVLLHVVVQYSAVQNSTSILRQVPPDVLFSESMNAQPSLLTHWQRADGTKGGEGGGNN